MQIRIKGKNIYANHQNKYELYLSIYLFTWKIDVGDMGSDGSPDPHHIRVGETGDFRDTTSSLR